MQEYLVHRLGWEYAYVQKSDLKKEWLKDESYDVEEYK